MKIPHDYRLTLSLPSGLALQVTTLEELAYIVQFSGLRNPNETEYEPVLTFTIPEHFIDGADETPQPEQTWELVLRKVT